MFALLGCFAIRSTTSSVRAIAEAPALSSRERVLCLSRLSSDRAAPPCGHRSFGAHIRRGDWASPFCPLAKQISDPPKPSSPRRIFSQRPSGDRCRFGDPPHSAVQGYAQHRKSASARARRAFRHGRSNRMSSKSRAC